jgi:hypothetical protein
MNHRKIYTRIDYSPEDVRERELAAAIAQRDKLAVALKKYGEHTCDCIKYITDDKECDCGLDTLLKECGK